MNSRPNLHKTTSRNDGPVALIAQDMAPEASASRPYGVAPDWNDLMPSCIDCAQTQDLQRWRNESREKANESSSCMRAGASGTKAMKLTGFCVDQVGFKFDVDYTPNDEFRAMQQRPPGTSCSIQIGEGLTGALAGSARNVYLVVTDIVGMRSRLPERGVGVGEIRHKTSIDARDWSFAPRAQAIAPGPSQLLPTPTATAESRRNEGTATCDVLARNRGQRRFRHSERSAGGDPVAGEQP